MKSGFIQLIVKNAIAGRRPQPLKQVQRYKPVDSFKKYIYEILPNIEESIQINILKKALNKISNPYIRKQLINAYINRLVRLKLYQKEQIHNYKQFLPQMPSRKEIMINPTIQKQLNDHNTYDVGSYALFNSSDFDKVFKSGCFGVYDNQYGISNRFGIMVRQECISIVGCMKILQKPPNFSIEQLKAMPSQQLMKFVRNQDNYPLLSSWISNMIYDKICKYKNKECYMRAWGGSVISDVLTNSILFSFDKTIQNLEGTIENAIQYIMSCQKTPSQGDFIERFKQLPIQPPLTINNSLPFQTSFYWQTPSFKSVFLGGRGGTGKSMILTYATMWAHKNGWIVIYVPSAVKWTLDTKAKNVHRAYNGLFVINQHSIKWLQAFLSANEQVIRKIPVDKSIYGKTDIAGVSQDQFEPVPNIYDQRRKTYSHQISEKVLGDQKDQKYYAEKALRMTDVLKQPKNIAEIIQAGIKNENYATCAMSQALQQVYKLDHPILQCVDGFSQFYRPSCYDSFRYFNDRGLYGKVPPYHIAHCRLFMHLDGHKIKRGLKIVASSQSAYFRHVFDITKINLPKEYEHHVRNLTPQQWKNASIYNSLSSFWQVDDYVKQSPGYTYTITQGNWGDLQNLMHNDTYY